MKYKILTLAMGLCLLESTQSFALTSTAREAQLENDIQKITAQTQELQKEVNGLKHELRQQKVQATKQQNAPAANQKMLASASNGANTAAAQSAAQQPTSPKAERYSLGSVVTTSPYIGLRSAFDASDLVVNVSTMNEDLRLLQERQTLENSLPEADFGAYNRPMLIISGGIEAYAYSIHSYNNTPSTSDIDLSRAELDTFAGIGPWAQGFLSVTYDNNVEDPSSLWSGNRVLNSRLQLKRGFLTIGNLNKSPFYATVGQMYIPFGIYTSSTVSDPVTKGLGRTTARALLLGYSKDDSYNGNTYASVFTYNGASIVNNTNRIDDFGANAGYKFSGSRVGGNFGAGYINNIADSILMQQTLASGFQGFSEHPDTENIVHQVPALDAHGEVDLNPFSIYGEYVATTRSFATQDLTFNGQGAKPRAMHVETDYNFHMFNRPSLVGVAYDESWQGLALGPYMPKNSYIAVFSTSIWKNTIEALEFRHDANYAATDTAGGRCDDNATNFCMVPQAGGQQNTIIGQIGVYF